LPRNEISLLNIYTIMALGFFGLTAMAYIEHNVDLAAFYLLMGGALLLGKVAVLFPRNKLARILADIGIILLAYNVIARYPLGKLNAYTLISWTILAAALIEAIYVLKKY